MPVGERRAENARDVTCTCGETATEYDLYLDGRRAGVLTACGGCGRDEDDQG